MLQIKLRSLILDLVHMLDVVRKLANAGVNSVGDWLWQKQLRFYLVKNVSSYNVYTGWPNCANVRTYNERSFIHHQKMAKF